MAKSAEDLLADLQNLANNYKVESKIKEHMLCPICHSATYFFTKKINNKHFMGVYCCRDKNCTGNLAAFLNRELRCCPRCLNPLQLHKDANDVYMLMCMSNQCSAFKYTHFRHIEGISDYASQLSSLKHQAHKSFDRLWRSGKMTRSQAYSKLASILGSEAHISKLNVNGCIRLIQEVDKELEKLDNKPILKGGL
jgi:hypothetical protein